MFRNIESSDIAPLVLSLVSLTDSEPSGSVPGLGLFVAPPFGNVARFGDQPSGNA